MRLPFRGSVRASLVYGLGMLAQHVVGALLLPVYTRWLPAAEFGTFEILSRTRDVFLLTAGSAVAITTIAFHQLAKDADERRRVALAALQVQLLVSITIALPMLVLSRRISAFLLGSPDQGLLVACILGVFFFDAIHLVAFATWQARVDAVLFVAFQAAIPVARAGWIVLFLATWNLGLRGVLLAWLLNSALFAAVMIAILSRAILPWPGWPDRALLVSMARYAWPFVPNSAFGFVLSSGDRYFLASLKGMETTGLYGLGYRLAVLAWGLLFVPFQKIWSASMIRLARDPEGRRRLAGVTEAFLALHGVALFWFLMFGPDVLRLVAPPEYAGAWVVVPVILLAQYWQTLIALLDASLYATRSTRTKAAITGTGAAVVLVLYATTIPRWGIRGAAWSTVAAYLLIVILTDRIGHRILALPLRRATMYGLPVLAAATYLVLFHGWARDGMLPPAARLAGALAFPVLAVLTGCIRPRVLAAVVREYLGGADRPGEGT